jgi:hypothetical protein
VEGAHGAEADNCELWCTDVLALAQSVSLMTQGWKLDSGATQHISNTTDVFSSFTPYEAPKLLQVGKAGVFLTALGEGTTSMQLPTGPGPGADTGTLTLTKTWYCPDCPFQLISTRRIVGAGYKVLLENGGATIMDADRHPLVWMELDASGLYTCLPSDPDPGLGRGPRPDFAGAVIQIPGLSL